MMPVPGYQAGTFMAGWLRSTLLFNLAQDVFNAFSPSCIAKFSQLVLILLIEQV